MCASSARISHQIVETFAVYIDGAFASSPATFMTRPLTPRKPMPVRAELFHPLAIACALRVLTLPGWFLKSINTRELISARASLAVESHRYLGEQYLCQWRTSLGLALTLLPTDALTDLIQLGETGAQVLSDFEAELLRVSVGHTLLRASFSREQLRKEPPLDSEPESSSNMEARMRFLHSIENNHANICREVIKMVEDRLIPHSTDPVSQVFYQSLSVINLLNDLIVRVVTNVNPPNRLGDLCCSLFDCSTPIDVEAIRKAKTAYDTGVTLCSQLSPIHPMRLRHQYKLAIYMLLYAHDKQSAVDICLCEHGKAAAFLDSDEHDSNVPINSTCILDSYILMDGMLSSAVRWIEGRSLSK